MMTARRSGSPLLLLLLLLCPAYATAETIEGRLESVGEATVSLAEKGEFRFPEAGREAITETLRETVEGMPLRLTTEDGVVTAIEILEPSFQIDATYQSAIETPDGGIILQLVEGAQIQIAPSKVKPLLNTYLVLEPGFRLRLSIYNYKIIHMELLRGTETTEPRQTTPEELMARLRELNKGDIVSINNNKRTMVIQTSPYSVSVRSIRPDGTPRGDLRWVPFGFVRSLRVIDKAKIKKTDPTSGKPEDNVDAIERQRIKVGDTVRVGLKKGVIIGLDDKTLALKVWDDHRFQSEETFKRAEYADKVLRTDLSSIARIPDPKGRGEIIVNGFRRRVVINDELTFKVRISHNLEGMVLAGTGLQAYPSGDRRLSPIGRYHRLPPIFARETYSWEGRLETDDTNVEMLLRYNLERNLVPIASQDAAAAIAERLSDTTDLDRLLTSYDAALQNGDERLLRVILHHAIGLEVPVKVQREARAKLFEATPKSVDIMISDLSQPAEEIRIARVNSRGDLVSSRPKSPPKVVQDRLLKVLEGFKGGVTEAQAFEIFNLYSRLKESDLGKRLIDVLKAHASVAVRSVVEVASAVRADTTDEELKRIDLAVRLLRAMGEPAIEPLFKLLRTLGAEKELAELEAMRSQASAPKIIDRGLGIINDMKRRQLRRAQNRRVREAQAIVEMAREAKDKEAEKLWQEALAKLEKVPLGNARARKVWPEIYLNLGKIAIRTTHRGEGAALLEKGLEIARTAGLRGKITNELKTSLGKVFISACVEEVRSTVLRAGPDDTYAPLRQVSRDTQLKVNRNVKVLPEWVPVFDGERPGWIRRAVVNYADGSQTVKVMVDARSLSALRDLLQKGTALCPAAGVTARRGEAELLAREAEELYKENKYHEALEKFSKLREVLPEHETYRLYAGKTWFFVYWYVPVIGAAIIVALLVFVVRLAMDQQTKVERPDEYVYYGRDRAQRERELE